MLCRNPRTIAIRETTRKKTKVPSSTSLAALNLPTLPAASWLKGQAGRRTNHQHTKSWEIINGLVLIHTHVHTCTKIKKEKREKEKEERWGGEGEEEEEFTEGRGKGQLMFEQEFRKANAWRELILAAHLGVPGHKSWHLQHASHMPGNVLSSLHRLPHWILTT